MFRRVHQLYVTHRNREWFYLVPLMLFALFMRFRHLYRVYYSPAGLPHSDDSKWYLDYAYRLLNDFQIGLTINDILYFGYNILLTVLLGLLKSQTAVIFLQCLVSGLSVFFVYHIALKLFNRATAVIASLFYANSWGVSIWSMYILSDSFFISLLLACVYLLLVAFETRKRKDILLFALSALYMLIFRPTGVVSLAFIFLYILFRLPQPAVRAFLRKYIWLLGGGTATALLAVLVLLFTGKLDPFVGSLQFNAKMVLYNVYAHGWIYDKATPYDYFYKPDYAINILNSLVLSFIINNWDHVSILYGKRMIGFLGWWVWNVRLTSLSGILSFAWHLLPTVLFLTGTAAAVKNGLFRKASIVWLSVLAVFLFCIFLFIDGMYRYKAPALPFLAIAAAYGTDRIIQGIIVFSKKFAGMLTLWNKKKF
ncbi:glycosyltransferase family 39 protein [Paenibacillus sp. GD4]|uniref:glycosyltransferase family 39 protein n=1 Tax=Paenibacillus sp. GD4 TaxID=3068890 RepID=UPI002796A935|nr:glycosyltransferase family 39 protein [Paenibacillus sp. GD4]MDQ1911460.1 glycosyltransferase family 39 protein [Paenibacillus sp. GD4]